MAPLKHLCFRKLLLLLYFTLFLFSCSSFFATFASSEISVDGELQQTQSLDPHFRVRRLLVKDLEIDDEETNPPPPKKKKLTGSVSSSSSPTSGTKKNQTKLIKPISSSSSSTKNQTKLAKTTSSKLNSTKSSSNTTKNGPDLKKFSNSTKPTTSSIKKSSDLSKSTSSKNKTTTKPPSSKPSPPPDKKKLPSSSKPITKPKPAEKEIKPIWLDNEEDDDFVNEFRDLPKRFQRTLIPDLEKISTTSKNYINKANKEITKKYFKPYFGNKYSPTIASAVSFIFILVPLLLVSLVFNRFKAYFSLQKLLIFIQIYLSIYFSILCLSSLVTGIEPLKFLYATSSSTYVCLQIMQTLGYVFYLLVLLMYLVLVFSTDCGLALKVLGLAQTFVGFAVGLHYYVTVFHMVVLRQPPKTNWKVHGVYATCFLMICVLSSAEKRKKEYLEESGDEGKKN
ncbi:hypothetical protein Bca4012_054667 [Brassica carinata]